MTADSLNPVVDSKRTVVDFPDGRVPGCLPRKTMFGHEFQPAADRIRVIPSNLWDEYDTSVKPFVTEILDQGNVGSCATEAVAQAIMIARAFAGLPFVQLNPWFIYQETSGGSDRGSSIDDNLRFVLDHGCAPESIWPRSRGWREKPSAEAYEAAKEFRDIEVYDVANINEMVSALLVGCPVVYGANGHAVVKIQHVDRSKGLDVNSWGTDWGDRGFGVWASYRAVNFSYGSFAVRAYRRG